ncbi:nucleotide sugar dehydrogenase [Candidatus Pelagibacter sp. HIMB1509]|uniref:nucleotide sugar dehydrogenase n=1 Tax=Candidatus Pelagibacter sp. HIMB1509 TaxID=3413339 RepID=UPI003F865597
MSILVIGLGKLGYPMAEFLSSSQLNIKAYDIDKNLINKLKRGINPIPNEKAIESYINNGNKINFFSDLRKAFENTEICFITVPTPSLKNKSFDNKYILRSLSIIAKLIKKRNADQQNPYIININSTVSPGSINNTIIPFLEGKGLINNIDFAIIYNPYFVALGDVVRGLESPDLVLIGCENKFAKRFILEIYEKIYKSKDYNFLNFLEAEATKLLINSFLTLKISFSNMVKNSFNDEKRVNVGKILNVVGKDSRIGFKYIKSGGPYSGPCLPRDTLALKAFSKNNKYNNLLADAAHKTNLLSLNYLKKDLELIKFTEKKSIVFAGIGYKSNTPSLEETFILPLIDHLKKKNLKVFYFDEYIDTKIKGVKKIQMKDIEKYSNLVFLSYTDSKFNYFSKKNNINVIDIWSQIEGENIFLSLSDLIYKKKFK